MWLIKWEQKAKIKSAKTRNAVACGVLAGKAKNTKRQTATFRQTLTFSVDSKQKNTMKKLYTIIVFVFIGIFANAQYTKLLDFAGTANGSAPTGSLISDGNFFYGMTTTGGTDTCVHGCGVIFKIKSDGTGDTTLLNFSGVSNGSYPQGSLISDGTFMYGMTFRGGANDYGVVFKIKPDCKPPYFSDHSKLEFLSSAPTNISFGVLFPNAVCGL